MLIQCVVFSFCGFITSICSMTFLPPNVSHYVPNRYKFVTYKQVVH